ncbi:MAG: hypothetical protein ACPGVO_02460 [Spirulinaceae cyanobacterium]
MILGDLARSAQSQPSTSPLQTSTIKQSLERRLRQKIGQLLDAQRASLETISTEFKGDVTPVEAKAVLQDILDAFLPQPVPQPGTQAASGPTTEPPQFSGKNMEEMLLGYFRPEFLNRIDERIVFQPLQREDLRQIVSIQLKRIHRLLAEQQIEIELTDAAQDYLVEAGYDPVYGARPLKRAIQRELENPIATQILESTFTEGDTILVDANEHGLMFTRGERQDDAPVEAEPVKTTPVQAEPVKAERTPEPEPEPATVVTETISETTTEAEVASVELVETPILKDPKPVNPTWDDVDELL